MFVDVYSQEQFRDESFLLPDEHYAVISIVSPATSIFPSTEFDLDSRWGPSIQLRFHDISDQKEGSEYILFSDEMAKQALEFIEANKDRHFNIHCDAGVSRSVAFGFFIRNTYDHEIGIHSLGSYMTMNRHVYATLKRNSGHHRLIGQ